MAHRNRPYDLERSKEGQVKYRRTPQFLLRISEMLCNVAPPSVAQKHGNSPRPNPYPRKAKPWHNATFTSRLQPCRCWEPLRLSGTLSTVPSSKPGEERGLAIALMREALGEACPAIDLKQKVG